MTRGRACAVALVAAVAVPAVLAGCPSGSKPPQTPGEPDAIAEDPASYLARLVVLLQDEVLTSYERDEPPELDSGMIDPRIGAARIGAGPGDVYVAGDLARAPSRWPLDVERSTRTDVRSKHLEIQIAADLSAAWMSDELSWRIEMCGRIAVVPLRITALYAHDGDRWVPVFEHLSFGAPPAAVDGPVPKAIKTEVASGDLRDELSGVLGRGLFRTPHDPLVVAQDRAALVLGPDIADEWRGAQVLQARLPVGRLEDRRVGLVGRDAGAATVAYWVGNYTAELPQPGAQAGPQPGQAGAPTVKVRMRVTHVFERRHALRAGAKAPGGATSCAPPRKDGKETKADADKNADCTWLLVQTHMSQPIDDTALARQVFGAALISPKPLQLDCSDGSRAIPAVVPRQGGGPPATQTP